MERDARFTRAPHHGGYMINIKMIIHNFMQSYNLKTIYTEPAWNKENYWYLRNCEKNDADRLDGSRLLRGITKTQGWFLCCRKYLNVNWLTETAECRIAIIERQSSELRNSAVRYWIFCSSPGRIRRPRTGKALENQALTSPGKSVLQKCDHVFFTFGLSCLIIPR